MISGLVIEVGIEVVLLLIDFEELQGILYTYLPAIIETAVN